MKHKFKSPSDVWNAVDAGKTVYWVNKSYRVFVEDNFGAHSKAECRLFSARGDKLLSVRCISNYFGSVLHPSELANLFTDDGGGS